jgi:glycosyltransferase involved in cell wall biosynthesis
VHYNPHSPTASSTPALRILVLSPYHARSHGIWIDQLKDGFPDIDWQLATLPARSFHWRIRSNPLSLYLTDALSASPAPDLILATSMTDLATLKGLFHDRLGGVPSIVYFHENQFAYPLTPGATASVEPKMVNLYSALAADRVVFNSEYNRQSFLEGARRFLARMPDRLPGGELGRIADKSDVIPVPVRGCFFERRLAGVERDGVRLVWNHRWEYDKGPERLLAAVSRLVEQGTVFRLELAGERFQREPAAFGELMQRFGRYVHDHGYLNEADYGDFLAGGGYVISTAMHDFQGLAVLEAAAAGCVPVVPDRLAYPEWFGAAYRYPSREDPVADGRELGAKILALLDAPEPLPPPGLETLRFDALAGRYRALFNDAAGTLPRAVSSARRP